MDPASPQIKVFASLPLAVALDADLNVDASNWHWVHCLTFPVESLEEFSHKPYKWIRFAVGVVIGAEGVLSADSDSPNAVDYNATPPAEPASLFYHISDEEKRRMFPVDPFGARSRITSSANTPRRIDFRTQISSRDHETCLLTGCDVVYCDAAHLLSYSKGDKYISTYTHRRSRDPARSDVIEDIDDIRNGLLLINPAHRLLGVQLAFLKTPNFAMDTTDVDPSAPPTEERYTTHIFGDLPRLPFQLSSSLRLLGTPDDPPPIIFDAVYAGSVLHHFGTSILRNDLDKTWNKTFYPGNVMNAKKAEHQNLLDTRTAAVQNKKDQDQQRDIRYQARDDALDMLMTLPYILVPKDKLQAMLRESKEKAEAAEQREVQEKVTAWARQVAAA